MALINVLGIVQDSTLGFSGISRIVETSERPQSRLGWFDERVLRSKDRCSARRAPVSSFPSFGEQTSPKAEASVPNVKDNLFSLKSSATCSHSVPAAGGVFQDVQVLCTTMANGARKGQQRKTETFTKRLTSA